MGLKVKLLLGHCSHSRWRCVGHLEIGSTDQTPGTPVLEGVRPEPRRPAFNHGPGGFQLWSTLPFACGDGATPSAYRVVHSTAELCGSTGEAGPGLALKTESGRCRGQWVCHGAVSGSSSAGSGCGCSPARRTGRLPRCRSRRPWTAAARTAEHVVPTTGDGCRHLYQHALAGHPLVATRCRGGRRRRGLFRPAPASMRLVWRMLTPIRVAAWSIVMCPASRLLSTRSLACSLCVSVNVSIRGLR